MDTVSMGRYHRNTDERVRWCPNAKVYHVGILASPSFARQSRWLQAK